MRNPILALIVPLGDGASLPGYGGGWGSGGADPGYDRPIHHPGHPDHGLPSSPGHPSQPIHHPGHPDHGLPSQPGHPGNRPPGSGSGGAHPDHSLPIDEQIDNALPPGEEIPPDQINPPLPEPPPEYSDKTIVAIKQPGEEWKVKAYDDVQAGHPLPPEGGLPHPGQPLPPTPAPTKTQQPPQRTQPPVRPGMMRPPR